MLAALVRGSLMFLALAADPPAAEEIARAAQQLGHEEFAQREAATELLWKAGAAAESALQEARRSTDPEIRARATALLEKLRLGIRPDMPADVVLLIDQFRFAVDPNQRRLAIRQLQAKGHWQAVFKLVRSETDPQQRKLLGSLVALEASKLVRPLVERGELAEAEEFLEQITASDVGLARFVAFLVETGRLDRYLTALQTRQAAQPATEDWSRLAVLLRAKGDLSGAIDAARKTPDLILRANLFAEAHQWAEAAAVAEQIHVGSPQRLEIAAFAATFYRLAGKSEDHERVMDVLLKAANVDKLKESPPAERPNDPFAPAQWNVGLGNAWIAAEALLVNGRIADALPILRKINPRYALAIYWRQHRHAEALEFVGVTAETTFDRTWFNALPAPPGDSNTQQEHRFVLAAQVARYLRMLGRQKQAEQIVTDSLQGLAAAQTDRGRRLTQLAALQRQLGRYDEALSDAAAAVAAGAVPAAVITFVLGQHGALAAAWYDEWLRADPQADRTQALAKAASLVTPQVPGGRLLPDWRQLVEAAQLEAGKLAPSEAAQRLMLVAQTYEIRGDREQARLAYAAAAGASPAAAVKAADYALENHEWQAAADLYKQAIVPASDDPLPEWLFGYALTQSGDREAGARQMHLASLAALAPEVRLKLATDLQARGLKDAALGQFQLVRQSAWSDSDLESNAAQLAGNLLRQTQPQTAADGSEHLLVHTLNRTFDFREVEVYLTLGQTVHKARAQAALAAGKSAALIAELAHCEAILPAEVNLVVELVPQLDRAKLTDQAERLFERGLAVHQQVLADFPESAMYLNNTAWLCARSQRQLDLALQLATKAVELSPDEASYQDTLAEVHFQRGDRPAAVAAAQRALALSQPRKLFVTRLKHFQEDELKSLDATEDE